LKISGLILKTAFGNRPDDEEDATAVNTATELALGMKTKPFLLSLGFVSNLSQKI